MGSATAPKSNYILVLLTLAYVLSLLDRSILPLLIEPLQRDLHISDTQFAVLHGVAFAVFYSAAILPLGWMADRYSRKKIMATGVALWSAMTAFSGLARGYNHLFLARMGVGIGEAALQPAAYSLIADLFPKERLARAIAIFSTGGVFGQGAAFIIAGAVMTSLGNSSFVTLPLFGEARIWQATFLFLGIPGLLLALLIAFIREPARTHIPPSAGANLGELKSFVSSRRALLIPLCLANALMVFVTMAFLVWTPAMLIRNYGLPMGEVGVVMGIAQGIGFGCGYILGGWLADRWSSRGIADAHVRVGLVGAIAALPLVFIATLAGNTEIAVVAIGLMCFCFGFPIPAAIAGLQLVTPPGQRAVVTSGYMLIANLIAMALAPLSVAYLTDQVFAQPTAVNLSLAIVVGIMLPTSGLLYALARRPFRDAVEAAKSWRGDDGLAPASGPADELAAGRA